MLPAQVNGEAYRFADFELLTETGELYRNGTRVRLAEQSVQILLALLAAPGSVVSRDELRERLWPDGTYVDFEHGLNAAVKRLRAALGDDADNPIYIETLPKRGYRFVAPVACQEPEETASADTVIEHMAQPPRKRLLTGALLISGLIVSTLFVLIIRQHRSGGEPGSHEAYELYTRSLGYKLEAPDNAQGIKLLERATLLDPTAPRLWFELSKRYDVEYVNAGRGQVFYQQARDANAHALALASDFWPARVQQSNLAVQAGQVIEGYRLALALTRARPEDGPAHYALSYALRYGGMYEESARECDTALKLDSMNPSFRSCSLVYILLGRYERASAYLDLDPLSTYVKYRRLELGILIGQQKTALETARSIRFGPHDYPDARLLESVLSGAPGEEVSNWSQETEALCDRISIPESFLVEARYLAWSGHTAEALRLLRRAIANNYCSSAMDSDPLLAPLRRMPEYKELRQAGIAYTERFRVEVQNTR